MVGGRFILDTSDWILNADCADNYGFSRIILNFPSFFICIIRFHPCLSAFFKVHRSKNEN